MQTLVTKTKQEEIKARLCEIECVEGVRILYACESGSRAWGFPSVDSDYDVRFIYAHPAEWYVTLESRRDVIERPLEGDLDFSGWDIRKALNLLRRSNPPLLEWLQSPIVYHRIPGFAESFKALLDICYAPRSCMHHYLNMSRDHFHAYLQGERVRTKKYFYALRPLLACLWLEQGHGPVPTEFQTLVKTVVRPGPLLDAINGLLESKREGQELGEGPRIPVFHEFLERQLARLEQSVRQLPAPEVPDASRLDPFFRSVIGYSNVMRQSS